MWLGAVPGGGGGGCWGGFKVPHYQGGDSAQPLFFMNKKINLI